MIVRGRQLIPLRIVLKHLFISPKLALANLWMRLDLAITRWLNGHSIETGEPRE